jgi:hypothetical protein
MSRRSAVFRQRERLPASLRVRFSTGTGMHQIGVASDLHEDGLFLRHPMAAVIPPGARLRIELPGSGHRVIAGDAEIIHRRLDGCGIRFVRLDPEARALLTELVCEHRRRMYATQLRVTQGALRRSG